MKQWIDSSGETDGAYETWQLFQQQKYACCLETESPNTPFMLNKFLFLAR